jgi:hypothetical protein
MKMNGVHDNGPHRQQQFHDWNETIMSARRGRASPAASLYQRGFSHEETGVRQSSVYRRDPYHDDDDDDGHYYYYPEDNASYRPPQQQPQRLRSNNNNDRTIQARFPKSQKTIRTVQMDNDDDDDTGYSHNKR